MTPEQAAAIHCDRCKCTCGLMQYEAGRWRCPQCIWDERGRLLEALKDATENYRDALEDMQPLLREKHKCDETVAAYEKVIAAVEKTP